MGIGQQQVSSMQKGDDEYWFRYICFSVFSLCMLAHQRDIRIESLETLVHHSLITNKDKSLHTICKKTFNAIPCFLFAATLGREGQREIEYIPTKRPYDPL